MACPLKDSASIGGFIIEPMQDTSTREDIGEEASDMSLEPENFEMASELAVMLHLADKMPETPETADIRRSIVEYYSDTRLVTPQLDKLRDKAISILELGAAWISNDLELRPILLNVLGNLYDDRFERLGNLGDVDNAIKCHVQAVSLAPDGDVNRAVWLNDLGSSHQSRFERLDEIADIDRAIEYQSQAVSFIPDGHINKPGALDNLGISYIGRFKRLGDPADIDKAIEYQNQAMGLTTLDEREDRPIHLSNIGSSYMHRFHARGELLDIDRAIGLVSQAVSLTPEGDAFKPERLNNLGAMYYSRFKRTGELSDIDSAIKYSSEAVLLNIDGYTSKPTQLRNLGNSYRGRFERLGELADIDRAVRCLDQALLLTPEGHAANPELLDNLGISCLGRYQRLCEPADIEKAIECQNKALLLTPDGHPRNPGLLGNLGSSHQTRFTGQGEMVDIDKAIEYQSRAVSLTPDRDPEKPARLNNLGSSHLRRFQRLGESENIDSAIDCQHQALLFIPEGHANKPVQLNNLGQSYLDRFERLRRPSDIEKSVAFFKESSQSSTGHPSTKLLASLDWARLSLRHSISSPLDAYEQVMALVPQIVWLGATSGRRYEHIESEIDNVAVEAAAAAVELQAYDRALEWLEEGRSIVWNQLLQLRASLEELAVVDPSLAKELGKVARNLDSIASLRPADAAVLTDTLSSEQASQKHRRLAERWEQLVDQVRLLSGFHDFLRPQKASELANSNQVGVVVTINVHTTRCDALILLPGRDDITHIPLVKFSHQTAVDAGVELARSLRNQGLINRGFKINRPKSEDTFEKILSMLWADVAKPVIDRLGFTQPSARDSLPHITWCTTGPLSFLPLHAAGDYSNSNSALFDVAISSYTPTLSALLASPSSPTTFSGIMAVGQTFTPGFSPLPGTEAELNRIEDQSSGLHFTRLDGDKATASAVLKGMEEHSWVHFACHATQSPADPTKSAFHLYGSELDLGAITQKPLKNAGLAFLSACQTATGDEKLSEEAIHLAAGMLMAGYQTVIATMWSIQDQDAPLIAEKVYAHLFRGGKPDSRRAAKALHNAVGCLREKVGVKEFARWAPYIHMGL